jgi:membrane protein YqaA with SNARE-associated domain
MTSEPSLLEAEGAGTHQFWDARARSRIAALVALGWGFAEATFFFVVPDVWIGLLSLFSWRAGLRAVCSAVMGALIGGAITYGVGTRLDRDRSAQLLAAVPAISPEMVEQVEEEMREHGPVSMFLVPLRGTPYKIYARTAGVQEQPLGAVLLWTIPARGARFVLVAAVAGLYGWLVRRITPRTSWLLGPYLLVWALFYVLYFRAYWFRGPRVLSPRPHSG